jgi:hypothetical protein
VSAPPAPDPDVRVRGGATAEELAAVLAVLRRSVRRVAPHRGHDAGSAYERWRSGRLAVLRRDPPRAVDR